MTIPTSTPVAAASRSAHSARYSTTAIALHWLLGLALLGLLGMGMYMTGLPFSPQRLKLYNWHKWAGMAFLGLSLLRLLWRLTPARPPCPPPCSRPCPAGKRRRTTARTM